MIVPPVCRIRFPSRVVRGVCAGILGVVLAVESPVHAHVDSPATLRRDWEELLGSDHSALDFSKYPHFECFSEAASESVLPLPLLIGLAWGESNFDARAKSSKNAVGIMQIRWPTTARALGFTSIKDLEEPCANIKAGARYLRQLLDGVNDDLLLALASYNHGPTAIAGRDSNLTEHARWYVRYVYDKTARVLDGAVPGPAQPWLRLLTFTEYGMAKLAMDRYGRQVRLREGVDVPLDVQRNSDEKYELRVRIDSQQQRTREAHRYERITGFAPE
jgi:Transglycosylase SLT domain